jgi:hypothetical protein
VEPELDVPVEPEVPELSPPDVVLPGKDELLPELLGLVEELELGLVLDEPLEP